MACEKGFNRIKGFTDIEQAMMSIEMESTSEPNTCAVELPMAA